MSDDACGAEDVRPPRKPAKPAKPARIKPLKKKIGEDGDNLARRAEWFQSRHGGKRRPRPT